MLGAALSDRWDDIVNVYNSSSGSLRRTDADRRERNDINTESAHIYNRKFRDNILNLTLYTRSQRMCGSVTHQQAPWVVQGMIFYMSIWLLVHKPTCERILIS